MNIIVLTPVRLLGDGLAVCVNSRPDMCVVSVVSDLQGLRDALRMWPVDAVLIDVTQGVELFDVRAIAAEWPDIPLVALGLQEQKQDVIRCGRAA
jgi:DNA-binding NarL/FixJ family response regulator